MMIDSFARRIAFVAAFGFSAFLAGAAALPGYVSDGLIAQWDGIDNAAMGTHDPSATTWTDLVGGRKFSFVGNVTVNGDRITFPGATSAYATLTEADTATVFSPAGTAAGATIEIVLKADSTANAILLQTPYGVVISRYNGKSILSNATSRRMLNWAWGATATNTFSVCYKSQASEDVYVDGALKDYSASMDNWGATGNQAFLGVRQSKANCAFKGSVYAIRVYNRELTAAERIKNNLVDRARFLKTDDVLGVAGNPQDLAAESVCPDYGGVGGLTEGSNVWCSVPAVWTNANVTIAAKCTGWKLYDKEGVLVGQGTTNEFAYVHPTPAAFRRLEWQWQPRYRITARASGGGSVDTPLQWVAYGASATVTATAGSGSRFLAWDGDGQSFSPAITLTNVDRPYDLLASFGPADWQVKYVSTTGDDATADGSAAAPFGSIQKAIDASCATGKVVIATGTYKSSVSLVLTNHVSLVSVAPENTAVTLRLTATGDKTKNVLQINASSASVVTNLTMTNGSGLDGSGIEMNSGLITHCVIRDCITVNISDHGGGINMSGGTVRFCDIYNCDAKDSGGAGCFGGGVYMTGGTVESCRIRKCRQLAYGSAGRGGGVYMTSGTLRNCLITGCRTYLQGSGVCAIGGTVENCTIVGNTQCASAASATGLHAQNALVRNNIVWGNTKYDGVTAAEVSTYNLTAANVYNNNSPTAIAIGSNNISVDPQFVDAAAGDYRLGYSDCVNGGSNQTWMASATDLDGNPRIVKNIVDIGCYERAASTGLECKFTMTAAKTLDTATATVDAEVDGDDTGLVYYWTFTRVDGTVVRLVGNDYREHFTYDFPAGVWAARLDVTNGVSATASSKIEDALDIRASVAYVGKTGDAVYPYATAGAASPSVDDAFALLGDGGTLYVDEGDYAISVPLSLSSGRGTRIIGTKGPSKTSIRLAGVAKFTSQGYAGITMNKAAAYVEGITLAGGRVGPYYSGNEYVVHDGVVMSAGVLTNCVLRDMAQYARSASSALKLSGGTAREIRIYRCSQEMSGGSPQSGIALKQTGGTLDRVVISNCWTVGTSSGLDHGGLVTVNGGEFRNGLIVDCTASHSAPVYITAGKLENTTIVRNKNTEANARTSNDLPNNHTGGMIVGGGTVRNVVLSQNWSNNGNCVSNLYGSAVTYTLVDDREMLAGEGNKVGDPKFSTKPGKAWHLKSSSPAFNAGVLLDWMTATSVDLDGMPRVRNKLPDMGCYEVDKLGLQVIVK